jgi:2-polyprenyl-3-methyl-5-hydroxy-6-metoxy-1,4-benzoquinol methylase
MSNPNEGDSTTSVPGIKGTNTKTGEESDEPQTATVRSTVTTETEPSRKAADLRTEFDSPTFVGASATSSIAISRFEEAYRARPPWDIDGPQPDLARLLDAGLIQGRVLDIGCGTGENALFFASRGIDVTGLDASAVAITRAQAKARRRGLSARFIQGDALQLAALGELFDTVTDSGLLHVFSDQEMQQVIGGIHAVLRPSGRYWLMCFSEHATLPGPRRLTKQCIGTLFKDSWQIRSIERAQFEVIAERGHDEGDKTAAAWLAGIERL